MSRSFPAARTFAMTQPNWSDLRDRSPGDTRPASRWLRVRAAADYLGAGVGTLNKLRTYGGGPRYAKPPQAWSPTTWPTSTPGWPTGRFIARPSACGRTDVRRTSPKMPGRRHSAWARQRARDFRARFPALSETK